MRSVQIPDIELAAELPRDCSFSMVAGDFIEVYGNQREEWDCIITCFFLDTASNVLDYVDTIKTALKPGGIWINLGPLLYHYEDMPNHMSLELSFDELRHVICNKGFNIQHEESLQTTYSTNPRSMQQVVFNCVHFTAVKQPNSS